MKKLILAIAIFLGASPLWAELMTYQGRLKESDIPVTGNRLFTFEFCDAEDGSGLCLIAPGMPANFAVANGLFKSTITIHPGVDLAAGAWYLRVTVGSSVLTPLERLTAVPYSVFASSAGYAAYAAGAVQKAGDTMTGQLTLDGSTLTVTGNEFSVGGSTFVVKNGYVGIGTASPNNPLQVHTNGLYVFTGVATGASAVLNVVPQTGGTVMLNNNAGGPVALTVGHTKHLLVDNIGNVGISSVTPSYRLVVSSGAGETGTIMAVSTGTSNLFWVAGDGAHATKFYGDGSGLSGVTGATDNTKVLKAGDTMTGPLHILSDDLANDTSDFITTGLVISTGGAIQTTGLGYGTVAGSARGAGAVDLQTFRTAITEVSSADYSVIGGGRENTAGGVGASVAGGSNNNAANNHSAIAGGENNLANGIYAFVSGGYGNQANGHNSWAGGTVARVGASGSFVWADSQGGAYAMDNNVVDSVIFKARGGFLVTGSTNTSMTGTLDRGVIITGNGLVGVSTGAPQAALDVVSTGNTVTDYAQIWRDSGGVARASVTATGVFYGNGSGLTGVTGATDDTKVLKAGDTMAGQLTASSFTATGIGFRGAQLRLADGDGVLISSEAAVGLGAGVRVSTNVYIVGFSSAARYYGDGSGLTGVTAAGAVQKSGDTMQGALDMNGNFLAGVSTITLNSSGSLAIVPDGTGGSNVGYGISIGSNTYNNYTNGLGIGLSAHNNYLGGVGLGNTAFQNHSYGVGVGDGATTNFSFGVGVGKGASGNSNYGVGIGASASNNDSYAVGVGAYSQNNAGYGAALGAYSYAASSATALGSYAKANAERSIAIGNQTVNDSTGTASFGNYAVNAPAYWISGSTVIRLGSGIGTLAIGHVAGMQDGGAYNLFVGSAAGHSHLSGASNVMLGYGAGYQNTDGAGNTFIGSAAGNTNVTGDQNIVIGYNQQTSASNSASELNIGGLIFGQLGFKTVGISTRAPQAALDIVSTGTLSTQFAQIWRNSAGAIVASMTANGQFATLQPLPGDNLGTHVAAATLQMGPYAINSSSAVSAAYYQVNGSTVISLRGISSFSAGVGAGLVNNGSYGTFVGAYAGGANTGGNYNSFFGFNSGSSNTLGAFNSIAGAYAGAGNTTGNSNAAFGYRAGGSNQTGSANAQFGADAGYGVASNSYSSTTAMGYRAGYGLTTGSANTFLGWQAGYAVTAGTNNIVIGYNQDTSAPTANNELNIGGLLYGNLQAREIYVGRGAAVSTITPYGFFGDGSGLTNITAAGAVQKTGDVMDGTLYIDGTGGGDVSLKITRDATGELITAGLTAGATAVIYADSGSIGLFSKEVGHRVGIGAGMFEALTVTQNRVGVNTVAPFYSLDVNGPGRFADQIIAGGSVTVTGSAFSVGASTFVVNSGRVGINWITPEAALQVSGGAKFLSSSGTSYILTAGSAARPDMFFVSSGGAVGMGDFTGVSVDTASAVQISSRLIGAANGTEDVRVGLFVESNTDGSLDSQDLMVSGNFEATVRGADSPSLVSPLRLKVRRETAPTGTVDRAIGLFIDDIQNEAGGTINNTYGIFIGDQSSGAQNNDPYALFSVDPAARSYFAGSVGIARTVPEARLDIAAAGLGPTFMGQIWRGFDGTIVSSVSATGVMMASRFVGDGSGLTNIPGVQKIGDTMTGALTMAGSSITIRNSFGYEGLEIRDPGGAVMPELRLARDSGTYWDIGGAGGGTPLVFQYNGINRMFLASEGHLTLNDSGQVTTRLHLRPAVTDLYSLYISSADSITPAFTVKPGGQLYTAGRVGIGSAAPTEALDISGRVIISTRAGGNDVTDGLLSFGSGGMEFYSGGTKYMKVANGGGYIGIGPSANVYSNTMSPRLQVKGSMSVGSTFNAKLPAANNLIVEGSVGVSTDTPAGLFQVGGGSLTVQYSGKVGIGTTNPDSRLTLIEDSVANSQYILHAGTSSASYQFMITTAGWVGINTHTPQAPLHLTAATKDEGIVVEHNSSTKEASFLALVKARGSAYSQSLVAEGDNLGVLAFGGYNGTSGDPFPMAAAIVGRVDGTPTLSAPDMPGRLEFMTAADNTNETVTRMVIRNDGGVGIATGTPQAMLDILSTSTVAQVWRDAGGVVRASMTASGVLYAQVDAVSSRVSKTGDNMSGNLTINVDPSVYTYDFATTGIQVSTAGSITTVGLGNGGSGAGLRGMGAVDLQTARAISGQVAQGVFSTLSGGAYNTILGSNTVVAGGRYNIAAGTSAVISGGEGNYAGSLFSTIGGGKGNSANGIHSAVFSGEGNFADEMFALVGGGSANTANTSYSVVVGGSGNEAGVSGGDGQWSFIGGGQNNMVNQNYGAIAGGMNNFIGDFADYAFIGGGYENDANGTHSAVAGGWWNVANSMDSFIGGGSYNTVDGATGVIAGGYQNKMQSGADSAFIGGGKNNTVTASGLYSAAVGGSSNTVSGEGSFIGGGAPQSAGNPGNKVYANFASIVGGSSNTINSAAYWGFIGGGINNQVANESSVVVGGDTNLASGIDAVVVGGLGNRATADTTFVGGGASNIASGAYAIVPGGRQNTAKGAYSFAAGYKSSSTLNGTFTWSDSVGLEVLNSVADQVMFKAAGGFWVSTGTVYADPGLYVSAANKVGIGTSAPGFKLHVRDLSGGAIAGLTSSASGTDAGVYGWSNSAATAIKGVASSGYAGRFEGRVFVTDDGVNPVNPAKLQVKGDLGLGNGLQDGNTPIVIWLTASTPFVDGDVVIVSGNYQFGTTTGASSGAVIGVAQGSGAASSTGKIAVDGVVVANCLNGTAGQHAVTSTTAGQVQGQGFPTSGTSVGIFLTNCGNPVVNRAVLLLK